MAADGAAAALLDLPATLTLPFCTQLAAALDAATRRAPASSQPLTAAACVALLRRAEKLLKAEPTLVHVHPPHGSKLVIVGDLHGQYHDLLTIFDRVGFPSPSTLFVFNGDFVDRGAWGLETVVLLAALKAAAPTKVYLVRGNHESLYCSWVYGFRAEVLAKYGSAKDGMVGGCWRWCCCCWEGALHCPARTTAAAAASQEAPRRPHLNLCLPHACC